MSRLYLGQDRGVREWAGCILFLYGCDSMGWLYLCQDMGVSVWAGCI
jgi:hypothetical protein